MMPPKLSSGVLAGHTSLKEKNIINFAALFSEMASDKGNYHKSMEDTSIDFIESCWLLHDLLFLFFENWLYKKHHFLKIRKC